MAFSFRPRLIAALAGYDRTRFVADLGAGLTVAVVALPLAMAFAIASGLKPEAGIFTTIIAGFLVALLGGSRVQIGGPAGAFIVIVYGIVQQYGVANLIIATALSGVLLFAMGVLRLGTLVRFIPVAVITGFTNGIAVLIGLSQIKDFLGLKIANMPADFFGILAALWEHAHTLNGWALGIAFGCLATIVAWQHGMPSLGARAPFSGKLNTVPGAIVALVLATIAVAIFKLPVETIGSRFGGIPAALPAFALPDFSWESARFVLMPAITLALLGAIESLLCARVADGIIGDRHDPNQELMAQGIANFVVPFFGGMPATGTIARTVTNVKSGATSPVAGMVHALVLLAVILAAAPLASSIPLACLAAILLHVAWNMGEWRAFAHLRRLTVPYRITLLSVFLLTVVFDLTVAVQVGILAACVTFIWRMAQLTRAEPLDLSELLPEPSGKVHAWRLTGALFFGSATTMEILQDALPQRALVLDLAGVIYMDTTGADALLALLQICQKRHVTVIVHGLAGQPADMARRKSLFAQAGTEWLPERAHAVAAARAACQ
ncbi:MAG: sodium-independent anion transporter [Burkholderiales bacterium 66-5]|uniref:SulP family inorganic anion transporter n=1 Tax=Comamonas badia TaxID=265291 RepID=UPI0003FCD8FA|nr:SulP family inorganic anion transporter [Comamonas badia]OJU89960.1 MAG: sodium-independent anion transporter [Burkholderiales bacterium 66-5]